MQVSDTHELFFLNGGVMLYKSTNLLYNYCTLLYSTNAKKCKMENVKKLNLTNGLILLILDSRRMEMERHKQNFLCTRQYRVGHG